MKTPWSRVRKARLDVEVAQIELEATLAQRPRAEALANELRHHRVTNGWTNTIIQIFGGA